MMQTLHDLEGFSVRMMCRLFGVATSTFYAQIHHQPSQREQENKVLKQLIMTSYLASHRRYGAPRIRQDLLEQGYVVSEKRVQKLMNSLGIHAITVKKYRPKSSSKTEATSLPNLLKQDFSTDGLNTKWVTDITYIYTQSDGWCYLSSILDLHSRKVIAWDLAKTMTTELVINTLKKALDTREVRPGLILHSDRGSQYTSQAYRERLEMHGILPSYSAKGYPYDNSCIESFHASLKKECVYHEAKRGYQDFQSCYQSLFKYIEGFYNPRRRHSSLNFNSPNNFEKQCA